MASRRTADPASRPATAEALLTRVAQVYAASLANHAEARTWLTAHGIRADTIEAFAIGWSAGTLVETLPEDQDLRQQLQQLGILDQKGHEALAGSITVPILNPHTGAVCGLYGYRLADGVESMTPPGVTGVVNGVAAKQSPTVIVTPRPLDAVMLHANGFRNALAATGGDAAVALLRELLDAHDVRDAIVVRCCGSNDAGRLIEGVTGVNRKVSVAEIEEPSLPAFFQRHTPEDFEQRLKGSNPHTVVRSTIVQKRAESDFELTDQGFEVTFGNRHYEVKGITRLGTQLRVVLKAEKPKSARASIPDALTEFELTTLDLYSARNRHHEAKVLSTLFDAAEPLVREDLLRLIEKAEKLADAQTRVERDPTPELTGDEKVEGLALLTDPAIEQRIVEDLALLGLVGEETNGLLAYLVATSRKLVEPLSMIVQSRSGAGKSTLQDTVLALVPPEDVKKFTRITNQALFYQPDGGLKQKLLALEEAEGMGGAVYSIRALQSAGEVQILATGKNATTGQMESRAVKVEGPVAVFMTTTRTSAELDGELASRNLFVTIDESAERTAAILARQRERMTLDGLVETNRRTAVQRRHWAAQRLLEPLHVVNPYATQLRFPVEALSARRDQSKYLALIRAIAFLRQKQREVKTVDVDGSTVRYVEVVPDDVRLANRLAAEVLGRSLDELSPPSRRLLQQIHEHVLRETEAQGIAPEELVFTRRDVRTWTAWSDFQVKIHIRELADLEYLLARQGQRGKEYRYVLAYGGEGDAGGRFLRGLVDPDRLVDPAAAAPEREVGGTWRPVGGDGRTTQATGGTRESREVGVGGGENKRPRNRSRSGSRTRNRDR